MLNKKRTKKENVSDVQDNTKKKRTVMKCAKREKQAETDLFVSSLQIRATINRPGADRLQKETQCGREKLLRGPCKPTLISVFLFLPLFFFCLLLCLVFFHSCFNCGHSTNSDGGNVKLCENDYQTRKEKERERKKNTVRG